MLVLAASGVQRANAADLSGLWVGYYVYDAANRTERVECSMVLEQTNDVLHGRMIEVQTFGAEPSIGLAATLTGTLEDRALSLVKTYDGTGGQTHSVSYKLKVSQEGRTLEGTWSIGADYTGRSLFKRLDPQKIDDLEP
jgi:hypothetical protein